MPRFLFNTTIVLEVVDWPVEAEDLPNAVVRMFKLPSVALVGPFPEFSPVVARVKSISGTPATDAQETASRS